MSPGYQRWPTASNFRWCITRWCTGAAKAANVNKDENHAPNNFVAVTVASPIGEPAGLLLRLPNGIVIEGIDEQSVSLVGKLVEQL